MTATPTVGEVIGNHTLTDLTLATVKPVFNYLKESTK
jgi:hypothetical protein